MVLDLVFKLQMVCLRGISVIEQKPNARQPCIQIIGGTLIPLLSSTRGIQMAKENHRNILA
jgi:hypothetical protein